MKIFDLPIEQLHEANWNPNRMDDPTSNRLRESISHYGLVVPLVVRSSGKSRYEVLSGNHRLRIIQEMNIRQVPCVIVEVNDTQAMLLAQVLNGIHGEDDLALKGQLFKKVLENIPASEVISLLPETTESLKELSTFKEVDMAEHLKAWEQARNARLEHMQLQFTKKQLDLVEEAISRILPKIWNTSSSNPNRRSEAIFTICKTYLEKAGEE